MRIAIKTLGCKSNRYESDRIFEQLREKHEVFELNEGVGTFSKRLGGGQSDVLIVNTCTVTNSADRKSRQAIRSFKKMNPACRVVAFGCGVNVSPQAYKEMQEVDYLAGNGEEVIKFANKVANEMDSFESCEYEGARADLKHGFRTRALVKIQDGCNSYCSYCIIPTARGPEYSFPSKQILREVKEKEAAGFREIVLTGINIGEWKEDGMDLGDLFEMLVEETSDVRFRVSSIEPKNFSEKFFELFKTGRFCPHMHMSLQSGSDGVLRRMRRHYLTDLYYDVCDKFKQAMPDIGLTTDIIVGFPGETEEEFQETCEFVRNVGFLKVHVFPYSKRKGTAACYMKNHISEGVKKERCKALRDLAEEVGMKFKQSQVGKDHEMLAERFDDGIVRGFTQNYLPVEFEDAEGAGLLNSFVQVRLKALDEETGAIKAVKR